MIDKEENAADIKVRIGTPIKDVLDVRRIMLNEGDRVILGGPMRGKATYSENLPVQPDTDAILIQDSDISETDPIISVVILTVALSVVLHGISAYPGANAYADWYDDERKLLRTALGPVQR